jgi:hypothetical protein
MSRPRDFGEMSFELHGERHNAHIRLQNVGARKPVSEMPVRLHCINVNGEVKKTLHEIFPCGPKSIPPIARIVVFRELSVVSVEDDEILIRIRKGIIEAAIFAQCLKDDKANHKQLLTFLLATLIRRSFCDCGCSVNTIRRKHSQSVRNRVTQLMRGLVINNGAFMAWDTTPDGSVAAELERIRIQINGADDPAETDIPGSLSDEDLKKMRSFTKKFGVLETIQQSYLQKSIPLFSWNTGNRGSLNDDADENNCKKYQEMVEEAIRTQLMNEAA